MSINNKVKIKYIGMINELLHLSYIKDNFSYNILVSKLVQLKEVIELTNFDNHERFKDIDQEINTLIEEIYQNIYASSNLNINLMYTEIENGIRLVNKRRLIMKSKNKR
jgi:hypothetical protein